jgi:shikimate 5-dehydrogenase
LPFAGAIVLEAEYRIPQISARDCRLYVSGRRWMLGQAVAGYRLFTGEEPNVQEMLRAL